MHAHLSTMLPSQPHTHMDFDRAVYLCECTLTPGGPLLPCGPCRRNQHTVVLTMQAVLPTNVCCCLGPEPVAGYVAQVQSKDLTGFPSIPSPPGTPSSPASPCMAEQNKTCFVYVCVCVLTGKYTFTHTSQSHHHCAFFTGKPEFPDWPGGPRSVLLLPDSP